PREQLHRRPAEPAPTRAERVRGRQRHDPAPGRDGVEGSPDRARPAQARRGEGDDLVPSCGGRAHAGDRAADVVPDPGARMGERGDADYDPHPGPTWTNESKCAPSSRSSVLPGITSAGTRVGETVKRTTHVPFSASSGTRSVAVPSGATAMLATGLPRTDAVTRVRRPAKSVGSEWRPTSSRPPMQRSRFHRTRAPDQVSFG